jgi:pilus assembly protein FimV
MPSRESRKRENKENAMARIRKLVLAIAAASALTSGVAHALGLGEVTLQSALNQPLVAEIELLEVRDLAASEVLPRLASPEEFSKAGVDHPFFLNDLTFTPVIKPNGKNVIRVSSSKPVREPYLNFLVEVVWPNGRLLREYTVLLDPPLYSPHVAQAVAPQLPIAASAPAAASAPVPVQVQSAVAAPRVSAPAPAAVAVQAPARATESGHYTTARNDTLWEIAQSVGGGSVQQTMLAIQDLNPNAFIDKNINRLKTGQVLRLPDEEQVKVRSRGEAIARVAEQNAAWQAWRQARSLAAGERQLDATKRSTVNVVPERIESGDSLRLVSGEEGQSTAGHDSGASGDSGAALDTLAVAKENLDTSRREGAELQSRMGDLQSQMEKLERLIELKDSQLARLQTELATESEPASPVGEIEPVGLENAPLEAVDGTSEAAPEAVEAVEAVETIEAIEASQPAVTATAADEESVVAPPISQPAAEEPQALLDRLLADPLLLGAVGGGSLLVLLLALMALSRRNAMKEAELQEGMALTDQEQNLDRDLALPNNSFDELDGISPSQDSGPGNELLGEVNIYIAYGRFNQAAELLLNALDNEPERRDLRLKLMEVFAEQGDRGGFVQQENELREIGGAEEDIRQLKDKYPNMASGSLAGAAMVGTGALAAGAYAGQLEQGDDDLAFGNLELDETGTDAGVSNLDGLDFADSLQLSPSLADDDTRALNFDDLDFDLQLDDEVDAALADNPAVPMLELPADALVGDDDVLSGWSLDAQEQRPAEPTRDATALGDLPEDFDLSLPEEDLLDSVAMAEPAGTEDFEAELQRVNAELDDLTDDLDIPAVAEPAFDITDLGPLEEDEFDFLSGTNETATKLDLARAYIDMGDNEGARDILDEVLGEGDEAQQGEARELIEKLS